MRKLLYGTVALGMLASAGDCFALPVDVTETSGPLVAHNYGGGSSYSVTFPSNAPMVFSAIGASVTESLATITAGESDGPKTQTGTFDLDATNVSATLSAASALTFSDVLGGTGSAFNTLTITGAPTSVTLGGTSLAISYAVVNTRGVEGVHGGENTIVATYTLESTGDPTPVNEPATLWLMGFSLLGLATVRHVAHKPVA